MIRNGLTMTLAKIRTALRSNSGDQNDKAQGKRRAVVAAMVTASICLIAGLVLTIAGAVNSVLFCLLTGVVLLVLALPIAVAAYYFAKTQLNDLRQVYPSDLSIIGARLDMLRNAMTLTETKIEQCEPKKKRSEKVADWIHSLPESCKMARTGLTPSTAPRTPIWTTEASSVTIAVTVSVNSNHLVNMEANGID